MNEIWKIIENSSKYEVSNFGRVRSIKTKRIIKTFISTKGYPTITLREESLSTKRKRNHLLHRLVAKAFIKNLNNHDIVNHINGNKKDYTINNLEWCNQTENIYHSKKISKNGAVISRQKILNIYNNNPDFDKEELLNEIIKNCK